MDPTDLLRSYYYALQAHTTKTPGPSFKALLKKAGIEEISRQTKPGSIVTNVGKTLATEAIVEGLVTAAVGGSWYNNIYSDIQSMPLTSKLLAFVTLASLTIDVGLYVLSQNDMVSEEFVRDGSTTLTLVLLEGADLFSQMRAARQQRETTARFQREREALNERYAQENAAAAAELERLDAELVILRQLREAATDTLAEQGVVIDILTKPISGSFSVKASAIDIFTQAPFDPAEPIAIVKTQQNANNPRYVDMPMSANGLQAWISQCVQNHRPIQHPLTRQPFALSDVRLYTATITADGGKRKVRKTRRAKRKH